MRQTSFHSSGVTGCTDSRPRLTSAISASFGLALIVFERRRVRHVLDGADVDAFPALVVGRGVVMRQRADLGDADDVEPLVGVVEEAEVADLHGPHVVARRHSCARRPIRVPALPFAFSISKEKLDGSDLNSQ